MYIEENIVNLIKYMKRVPYKHVYIGDAPIDEDECIVVRAISGSSKVHFNKETYDYPHYSIYIRSGNNKAANELTNKVYTALANFVGPDYVIIIRQLPRFVGRDKKDRSLYSFTIEYQLGGY